MQLGKKSKTTNAFEQLRGELAPETELATPLAPSASSSTPIPAAAASTTATGDREAVHLTVAESISAKVSREGSLEALKVKGDLQLRITDKSLTQIKLALAVGELRGAQLRSHPKVDKNLFRNENIIQTKDGFPVNQSIGVMRWEWSPKASDIEDAPITFNVWTNDAGGNTWNITVEYEWGGSDPLRDVRVTIPYATTEPTVSSFDAIYEVAGDSIDWTIGTVDDENPGGSFEFEAQAVDEGEFFPMVVHFQKSKPYVDIDVSISESTVISVPDEALRLVP
jgi:hypothetical protein